MKILVLYRHLRLRKWLPMYLDGALDQQRQEEVKSHLKQCTSCSNMLAELKNMRTLLAEESSRQIAVPEAAFFRKKLQPASGPTINRHNSGSRWMQTGWALACTILLTASILFVAGKRNIIQHSQSVQSSSVFDLNGLIETFHEEDRRQQFYAEQGAVPVIQGQCCSTYCAGCCDTRMLTALQEHCSVLKNRLLKSADGKSIILECTIEGNMITIVRQTSNAASPLENSNMLKQSKTGVLYERSLKNDVQITRWQNDSGKVTVLGDLSDNELAILIDASK